MKRTYSDQEMTRILKQELVIPEEVNIGMRKAYEKLGIQTSNKHTFFIKRKVFRVLAAAAVLAAGSSLVVLAANKFLSANLVKEEESVTYDLAIDHGQAAHEIEVEPTYMPAGYKLGDENSAWGGKWHNDKTGGTITIVAANAAELDERLRLGDAGFMTRGMKEENLKQELDINGMKVALFLSGSGYVDSDKNNAKAMLFNEDEGYLVEIFNSNSHLPIEETIKIAQGLDIRILDSTVPYKTDEEIESMLAEREIEKAKIRDEMKPELLADNNFFSIGEELKIPFTETEYGIKPDDICYTVESVEIKDALPASEYPAENYSAYEESVARWLNEDGSLKPHERYKYPLDENGYPTGEPAVETVDSKFVVVHMKVKNNNEVNPYDDYEVCVSPELKYLKKDAGGNYVRSRAADAEYFPANEGYGLQYGISVYFDKMYYTEGTQRLKHFHFVPMDPGEEMEYTLAYVVDEDRLDSAFFQFYSGYDGWPVPEGGNEYVYVKIEQ